MDGGERGLTGRLSARWQAGRPVDRTARGIQWVSGYDEGAYHQQGGQREAAAKRTQHDRDLLFAVINNRHVGDWHG